MGTWRRPPAANQNTASVRVLLRKAQEKGYKVDSGSYVGDSLIDGPMYLLVGAAQQVTAWFDLNGKPCFKLGK